MNDRIHIRDLSLPTVVGVPDEERLLPQTVAVDVTITPSRSFRGIGDRLEGTIDYFEVVQELRRVAAAGERRLIETLTEDLADAVLGFRGVEEVRIELKKFILPHCGSVGVEVVRSRNSG